MASTVSSLRFRQVHLDFHTSPAIPDVGADFDPDEFADTLARAHVNSVTCFARCHHGMIYYATKRHPERIHPGLVRPNLLAEQIEACHKRGIRVPIYTTVEWDEYTADRHRDWLLIDENGCEFGTKPLEPGFYRFLDVLHPGYRQFLKEHVADLFECVPVDGLFFDICIARPSLALHWLEAMDAAGLNPESPSDRMKFARRVMDEFMLEMTEYVRSLPGYTAECTIFYNSGHVGPAHRSSVAAFTHYELESLPSGGWGYLHFPLTQRFARGLGKPTLGMTGKFHTSWGDFHSYKNPAALAFETRHMLALGASCSIGDQLHPRGRLDPATYALIGRAYEGVEACESWCVDAKPVADLAFLTPEEAALKQDGVAGHDRLAPSALGATRMLQELSAQFDVLTSDRDFGAYKVLVLPDEIPVDRELADRLEGYVASGGALLFTGRSSEWAADEPPSWLPATDLGDGEYEPDFFVPSETLCGLSGKLEPVPYVMYRRGRRLQPAQGAETLGTIVRPYFNRTWRHFCSHRHAPTDGQEIGPAAVRLGNVITLAHPVFTLYHEFAPLWCKEIVRACLEILLPTPSVRHNGPSTLLAALTEQAAPRRRVLHLLHYIPERRARHFDVLEDILPVYGVECRVAAPGCSSVRTVPEGVPLEFSLEGPCACFTVPEVRGHLMIELA